MRRLFIKNIMNTHTHTPYIRLCKKIMERRLLAKQPLFIREGVLLAITPSKVVLYV